MIHEIDRPIIIVHKLEDGKTEFIVNLDEFFAEDPTMFGPIVIYWIISATPCIRRLAAISGIFAPMS